MEIVAFFAIVVSSIWVYFDAKALDSASTGKSGESPGAWLLSCLLLWIVFFPYYLIKRGSYKEAQSTESHHYENSSRLGCLGAVLFVVGILFSLYFFLFYDTSVAVDAIYLNGEQISPPMRVNNIGKMNDRQVGVIVGIGFALIGILTTAIDSMRNNGTQGGKKSSKSSAPDARDARPWAIPTNEPDSKSVQTDSVKPINPMPQLNYDELFFGDHPGSDQSDDTESNAESTPDNVDGDFIRYICIGCGKKYKASVEMEDRRTKCSRCGNVNVVPKVVKIIEQSSTDNSKASVTQKKESAKPMGHLALIKYRCFHCNTVLESEGHLASQKDTCPVCHKTVSVPTQSTVGFSATMQRVPRAAYVIGAVSILIIAMGVLSWFVMRDTWERDHYGQIQSLSEEIVLCSKAGRHEQAVLHHEELTKLLSTRIIQDEFLKQKISESQIKAKASSDYLAVQQQKESLARIFSEVNGLLANPTLSSVKQASKYLKTIDESILKNPEFQSKGREFYRLVREVESTLAKLEEIQKNEIQQIEKAKKMAQEADSYIESGNFADALEKLDSANRLLNAYSFTVESASASEYVEKLKKRKDQIDQQGKARDADIKRKNMLKFKDLLAKGYAPTVKSIESFRDSMARKPNNPSVKEYSTGRGELIDKILSLYSNQLKMMGDVVGDPSFNAHDLPAELLLADKVFNRRLEIMKTYLVKSQVILGNIMAGKIPEAQTREYVDAMLKLELGGLTLLNDTRKILDGMIECATNENASSVAMVAKLKESGVVFNLEALNKTYSDLFDEILADIQKGDQKEEGKPKLAVCPHCHGSGQLSQEEINVLMRQYSMVGGARSIKIDTKCRTCNGKGIVNANL